jgi:protein-disulfide isomerase
MSRKKAALAIAAVGLMLAALRVWSGSRCAALTDTDRARLMQSVQARYNLQGANIGVADGGTVRGSCFHKLVFASLSGRRFRADLFASPDFRYLASELWDASPDPKETERRRRETALALVRGDPPTRGSDQAPATLAIFSDFQCPYCQRMAETLNRLAASEGGRLRIVYHYFPLSMHRWARPVAQAAACAHRQGNAAFWSLHDFLFAHQRELTADNVPRRVEDWAHAAPHFDAEKSATCVKEGLTSGQVEQDMALGVELGVHGTPTLFLNGEFIDGGSADEIRASIRRVAAGFAAAH